MDRKDLVELRSGWENLDDNDDDDDDDDDGEGGGIANWFGEQDTINKIKNREI